MEDVFTKYGTLKGATHAQFYPNGNLRECTLTKANEIETPYGILIPQYMDDGFRRKRIKPVIFYENGNIKNLPLQNKVEIETTVGALSAELLTWYEDGSIRRVFPLDSMLSGFWTEEDEYELSEELEFELPFGKIKQKIIAVQFYKCGPIKNITFWPKDTVTILSPFGPTEIRIGVTVYPDGKLKSFEPNKPLILDTPIGKIQAFDRTAIGIHSDSTSLRLTQSGVIENVVTSTEMIKVVDKSGKERTYAPRFRPSIFNLTVTELTPISIQFYENKVRFNNNPEHEYKLNECSFTVSSVFRQSLGACSSCDNCTACKNIADNL